MNSKLGCSLWEIKKFNSFWKNKRVATAGIAYSKGKNGGMLGFVGTTSLALDSIHCDCRKVNNKQ
jgi:hypothetical protein